MFDIVIKHMHIFYVAPLQHYISILQDLILHDVAIANRLYFNICQLLSFTIHPVFDKV